MGFSIYYRSTESIEPDRVNAIKNAADAFNEGRTWLSCEPLCFFDELDDGRLFGSSKPNFGPHPDDVAAARAEGRPDGTIKDVLDALCAISRAQNVDWEFSHDHDPGPIGFVRSGVADDQLLVQIGAIGELAVLASMADGLDSDPAAFDLDDDAPTRLDNEGRDDDAPPTIRLWSE